MQLQNGRAAKGLSRSAAVEKVRRFRDQVLEENSLQRVEILAGLGRFADAERVLQPILDKGESAGADPVHRLAMWTKAARLADMEADDAKTRQRWLKVIELGNRLLARN